MKVSGFLAVLAATTMVYEVKADDDARAGQLRLSADIGYVKGEADPRYAFDFEGSGLFPQLKMGWYNSSNLAFDFGYGSYTSVDDKAYIYIDSNDGLEVVEADVDYRQNVYTFSTIFNGQMTDRTWATMKIGASRWSLDAIAKPVDSTTHKGKYSNKDHGLDLTLEAGLTYWLYQELSLTVTILKQKFDTGNFKGINVEFTYNI